MKKLWSYVSAILFGIILGIVLAVKWLTNGEIEINIDKIKNKRTAGDNSVTVPITVEKPGKRKKKSRGK